jgi:DNA-binding NarL/FixJ family response regulator
VSYGLGDDYEVISFLGENLEDLPDMLATPPEYKKIDALITCVPHNLLTNTYDRSLEIIAQVRKQNPKMPIIAYTAACADEKVRFATQRSIDAIVGNNGEFQRQADADRLRKVLDGFFGRGSAE